MILKASQRGGAAQLAAHLLKTEENEHVELHEIRGFTGETVHDALKEAYAVSRGTRCRQFMFSLSLSPPPEESVSVGAFEDALDRIERKLGLSDQPRVIIFHEKEARRHAHCVWSRIDVDGMKAINLPHFKRKLGDVSRDLYLDHGWQMPRGFADAKERDPFNFSREQWQQARRTGQNPKVLKQTFRECWAMSDSAGSFANALKERGLYLAQGDRRGFVAVDHRGEVYSIAKWTELRTKEVRAKLGDPQPLPTVEQAKELIASRMTRAMTRHIEDLGVSYKVKSASFDFRKAQLVQHHGQSGSSSPECRSGAGSMKPGFVRSALAGALVPYGR